MSKLKGKSADICIIDEPSGDLISRADAVSREQYDHVCEEYNRLVHKAVCVKLCDENCEYEKGKTCYHAREHSAIEALKGGDAEILNEDFRPKYMQQCPTDGADLISRADAVEAVGDWMQKEYGYLDLNRAERLIDALSALPSADAVHKPDYSYEADMVRRLAEAKEGVIYYEGKAYKGGTE